MQLKLQAKRQGQCMGYTLAITLVLRIELSEDHWRVAFITIVGLQSN